MLLFSKWISDNNGLTIDWWRHVLERIDPADYLAMNYFDKLAQSCMAILIDDGTANMSDFVVNAEAANCRVHDAGQRSQERCRRDCCNS